VSYIHGMAHEGRWTGSGIAIPILAGLVVLASACSSAGPSGTPSTSSSRPTPSASASTSTGAPGAAFDPANVRVGLKLVTGGLEAPLFVTGAGDGSGRLFVVQQGGQIRIVANGRLRPKPFLDISSEVTAGGEQGLLGLAFHPDYRRNGRFYVDYTDRLGDTVVARYHVDPKDPNRADPSSAQDILNVAQPFANHNGGDVAFGPDGNLYISLGDGGSEDDPDRNGQNLETFLSKILRIDVDHPSGGRPYSIPADNPFAGRSGARPETWAFGLRNPWRFSFDRLTHDLWIGDVGQNQHEEIDHAPAGQGGQNYGWSVMEGPVCFRRIDCDRSGLTLPVASYTHSGGRCSVSGGYVYRGHDFPALRGGYFFGDFCTGEIFALDAAHPRAGVTRVLQTNLSISSFGEDDRGEVFVTSLGTGQLFEVTGRRAGWEWAGSAGLRVPPGPLDHVQDQLGGAPLDQVAEHARLLGAAVEPGVVVGGEDQHLDPRQRCLDLAGRFDAIHAGHAKVHEDDLWPQLGREAHRLVPVPRLPGHPDALCLEHVRQGMPQHGLVLHDQHAGTPVRCGAPIPLHLGR